MKAPTDPSKRNREKRYSKGEQVILEAAEVLFAEKGFDAVSMSAIARLANTSKPNIYHHFNSKNDLYMEVLKSAANRSSALLDALADAPGTFEQRLSQFSAGQLDSMLSHQRSTQLILRETLSGSSQRGREIAEFFVRESFARLAEMVHHGQEAGEFRNDLDSRLAAFMVFATNLFFFQASPFMQYVPEFNITEDQASYSRSVMDVLFRGIRQSLEIEK